MGAKTISIFVDESGSFTYPDEMSPYYLVGLVLHDQDKAVQDAIVRYERELGGPRAFTRNILRSIKPREM